MEKLPIAINGAGRIGRCLIRALYESPNYSNITLKVINTPGSIEQLAHLLQYDSSHGRWPYKVSIEKDHLKINNDSIYVSHISNIQDLQWEGQGIKVVLECTGKFTDRTSASYHIRAGAEKVIISAPSTNADITVICGVNDHLLYTTHQIVSIGSCTTNAFAPIVKILHEELGIISGFMTTIHAYTNDQNLLDSTHSDLRRARSAALSMIPTKTGAASTIGLVIPELTGKLDGAAIRVPVANVSMIDFTFTVKNDTSINTVNDIVKSRVYPQNNNIIGIAEAALVSCDFNHLPYSAIFDPWETRVVDKNFVRVVAWYDNEWGFVHRMLDVASKIAVIDQKN